MTYIWFTLSNRKIAASLVPSALMCLWPTLSCGSVYVSTLFVFSIIKSFRFLNTKLVKHLYFIIRLATCKCFSGSQQQSPYAVAALCCRLQQE